MLTNTHVHVHCMCTLLGTHECLCMCVLMHESIACNREVRCCPYCTCLSLYMYVLLLFYCFFFVHSAVTPFFDTKTQKHPQNPLRINQGNRAKISCFGIGNPTSLTSVEDVTSGTPVVLDKQREPKNALFDYIIDIPEVSKLQYRCVARNSLGTRVYDFTVIIQG